MTGIIVVGTGRCGSTLISDLMNAHPAVLSISEFFSMAGFGLFRLPSVDGPTLWKKCCHMPEQAKDILRGPPIEEILADVSQEIPDALDLITIPHLSQGSRLSIGTVRERFKMAIEARPKGPAHEHFQPVFEALSKDLGASWWVERSGGSLEFVNELRRAFPDVRFVHIYRNGPDTAVSLAKHPYFRVRIAYRILSRPWPAQKIMDMDIPLVAFGRYWANQIVHGVKALEGAPVHHVQYEKLVSDTETEIDRMFEFMEVPVDQAYIEAAQELVQPPKEREIDGRELRHLEAACELGTKAIDALTV